MKKWKIESSPCPHQPERPAFGSENGTAIMREFDWLWGSAFVKWAWGCSGMRIDNLCVRSALFWIDWKMQNSSERKASTALSLIRCHNPTTRYDNLTNIFVDIIALDYTKIGSWNQLMILEKITYTPLLPFQSLKTVIQPPETFRSSSYIIIPVLFPRNWILPKRKKRHNPIDIVSGEYHYRDLNDSRCISRAFSAATSSGVVVIV